MTELSRIRVAWSGWPGGPGVSTFFFTGTDYAFIDALNAWVEKWKAGVPSGITITVPGSGDIIDEASGALTGQWQHGNDTKHVATGPSGYQAAGGILIQWHTSVIHGRRRLQGHTFLVPQVNGNFDSSGGVVPGIAAAMTTDANAFISQANGELAVWGRPKGGQGGTHGAVTFASVPLRGTVLRSRRG